MSSELEINNKAAERYYQDAAFHARVEIAFSVLERGFGFVEQDHLIARQAIVLALFLGDEEVRPLADRAEDYERLERIRRNRLTF